MSWVEKKEIQEERANLLSTSKQLLETAEKEQRNLNADEQQKINAIYTDIESLDERSKTYEKQALLERTLEQQLGKEDFAPETRSKASERAKNRAFNKYCRFGRSELTQEERSILTASSWANQYPDASNEMRALGITNDPGGSLIPQTFNDKLYMKLKYYGGVRRAGAEVFNTPTGAPYKCPIWDDTANSGELSTAGTAISDFVDPNTSNLILQGWIVDSGILKVNIDFFQDQDVDIESKLSGVLAVRYGRKENSLFTTGAGSTQPQGILTGLTNTTNSTTGGTVVYKDLVNLVYSVDVAYNDPDAGEESVFMCNQNTVGALRNLVDSQGRPIWLETSEFGISGQRAYTARLMGYRVVINNNMDNIAVGKKPILFGNFKRYYVIRDVAGGEVVRFGEVYMPSLQLGFMYYKRVDGAVRDANAVWGLAT